MNKLYRILGKRGRITIPYEIRRRVGFSYNDALSFRHGWKLSASDYLDVRAIGSYDANICYCIEPGVMQNTGDAFSRMGEDFWENMPDFNDLKTAITDETASCN